VTAPLLELRHLTTLYVTARGTRVFPAVDEVSLRLDAGETLSIVGESGSGKTTLALSIVRLLPPAARIASGEVLFEGEDLVTKPHREMQEIRGKRIAMILQDPMASLNPLFTVGDQVAEPIRTHMGVSRAVAWTRARELLRAVRIAEPEARVYDYPHQLSGGMRQRIAGAIAISCKPHLLIADEPTTNLDVTTQADYLRLLRELQRRHGLALILITHDLGIVAKMGGHIAVMYAGRIVESGPVGSIFNAPAHPYTRGLLESIPRVGNGGDRRLTTIAGQPPDPLARPAGCAFHPRCAYVMDRCRVEEPPAFDVANNHTARCWLAARGER
jgi:oligopeptide/dipeptide ABC transporter ATP-binding protein